MSVTLKLADDDAKLVGQVLGILAEQETKAREGLKAGRQEHEASRMFGSFIRENINRRGNQQFEELRRIGAAFDTAVYANEPRR